MTYLSIGRDQAVTSSSDSTDIRSTYFNHPRFSFDCDFCQALHYLFIRYVPMASYSRGYTLRACINQLLDYTVEYEKGNPSKLHLNHISLLNAEIFQGFKLYVARMALSAENPSRLRGALIKVAKSFDEGFPLLTLPSGNKIVYESHEPLSAEALESLGAALKCYVDELTAKIEFRRIVDSAIPYTVAEVLSCYASKPSGEEFLIDLGEWNPDPARMLKTLIDHGYPLWVDSQTFSSKYHLAKKNDVESDIILLILNRCLKGFSSIDEALRLYFPTATDQAVIVLFLMLQTGWNKETVTSIDKDRFEHELTGALDVDNVLIFSEKNKSQGLNVPFSKPKQFMALSSKSDKYSAYNLILLARKLSSPFFSLDALAPSGHNRSPNPLFSVIRRSYVHLSYSSSMHLTVTNHHYWMIGVNEFLSANPIFDSGRRLKTSIDIVGRLRPTWIKYERDTHKSPLSVIALQQGHNSIETTDIHYDSSPQAMQDRRHRLRSELESILTTLKEKKFKGILGKKNDITVDRSIKRVFSIPGHSFSLWACTDPQSPDFHGHERVIDSGANCSSIPNCMFCSRVCLTEESLPFLMHRKERINDLTDGKFGYASKMKEELNIIDYVLDEWGDESALIKAARYLRKNMSKMPQDFSSLEILFEG